MILADFSAGILSDSLIPLVHGVLIDTFNSQLKENRASALEKNLLVGYYQGYDPAQWTDSANAVSRANLAITACQDSDYTPGSVIFLDCEDAAGITGLEAWVSAWAETIFKAGYQPGVYIGVNFPCDWTQVNYVEVYWKSVSLSGVPNLILNRTYDVYQVSDSTDVGGLTVDFDIMASEMVRLDPGIKVNILPVTTPVSSSNNVVHEITVTRGMTLWSLTKGNWNLIHEIQDLNHMGTSTVIDIGQKLIVPAGVS